MLLKSTGDKFYGVEKEEEEEQEEYIPEEIPAELRSEYMQLVEASRRDTISFNKAIIETVIANPGLMASYIKRHKEKTIEKIAMSLSRASSKLIDLPIDTLQALSNISIEDMSCLFGAIKTIQRSHVSLSSDDIKAVIDTAKVMKVMEEQEPNELNDFESNTGQKN